MPAIYQHAEGILLEACLPDSLDLTGASFYAHLRKPSGSVLRKAVTESSGRISYTTVANDLDAPGTYLYKVFIEYTDGRKYSADPVTFHVWPHDREGS